MTLGIHRNMNNALATYPSYGPLCPSKVRVQKRGTVLALAPALYMLANSRLAEPRGQRYRLRLPAFELPQ